MELCEKRLFALLAAIAAISACDGGSTASDGNAEVERYADLPACDERHSGQIGRVKSWDAEYFCNGKDWVPVDEKPAECDSSGVLADRRDGKTYRCADWGHGVWMVDNLNLGQRQWRTVPQGPATIWTDAYKYCENDDRTCPRGALYTWSTAVLIDMANQGTNVLDMLGSPHRGLCPMGWHIPTKEEFLAAFGDDEALERQWPNTKDTTLAHAFEVEVWTADGGGCRKGLSGTDDVSAKTEWGRVRCEFQTGSKRLRCVQD